MGADFIAQGLWQRCDTELDWDAGFVRIRELDDEALLAVEEYDDRENAREALRAALSDVQQALTSFSRERAGFTSPDGRWLLWLSGGMSWGDSPTDLYDSMDLLWVVPSVLDAVGFVTRENPTNAFKLLIRETENVPFRVVEDEEDQ